LLNRYLIILILFASTVFSQTKVWISLKGDSCFYTPQRAAFLYFERCSEAAKETTILVYVKQGFWWHAPEWYDSTVRMIYDIEYQFTIDSIIGRGDNRKVLLSTTYRYLDTCSSNRGWLWLIRKEGPVILDSINKNHSYAEVFWDTLGIMPDTLRKISRWLTYSRKILDQTFGVFYIYAGSTPVEDWEEDFPGKPYNWRVKIRLEKILGDPTKNFGWDQRAVLKMSFFQVPNDSLNMAVTR